MIDLQKHPFKTFIFESEYDQLTFCSHTLSLPSLRVADIPSGFVFY